MLQHEGGKATSEVESSRLIKGEPSGGEEGNFVVVEVINEDAEYDENYELAEELVEVDETDAFKLDADENDAFVTGLEFEEDEVNIKN